jgi:hypothetical protein
MSGEKPSDPTIAGFVVPAEPVAPVVDNNIDSMDKEKKVSVNFFDEALKNLKVTIEEIKKTPGYDFISSDEIFKPEINLLTVDANIYNQNPREAMLLFTRKLNDYKEAHYSREISAGSNDSLLTKGKLKQILSMTGMASHTAMANVASALNKLQLLPQNDGASVELENFNIKVGPYDWKNKNEGAISPDTNVFKNILGIKGEGVYNEKSGSIESETMLPGVILIKKENNEPGAESYYSGLSFRKPVAEESLNTETE